jgi:hypothetical protein
VTLTVGDGRTADAVRSEPPVIEAPKEYGPDAVGAVTPLGPPPYVTTSLAPPASSVPTTAIERLRTVTMPAEATTNPASTGDVLGAAHPCGTDNRNVPFVMSDDPLVNVNVSTPGSAAVTRVGDTRRADSGAPARRAAAPGDADNPRAIVRTRPTTSRGPDPLVLTDPSAS